MGGDGAGFSSDAGKRAVLVSGMHRSGTSAVSRALSFLGFSQPQMLIEAGPDNPKGFWESTKIVQVNQALMQALGWTWDEASPFTAPGKTMDQAAAMLDRELKARWLHRARAAIRASYREDAADVVCKDPRLSLFPAFWQAAFEAEGFAVRHVLAFRDPLQVAASIHKQRGVGRPIALRAWLNHSLRPFTQVKVAATIDYADLRDEPRDTVNAVARVLGVSELDSAAVAELEDFIDRGEQVPEIIREGPALPEIVPLTHQMLRDGRAGVTGEVKQRAVGLKREYDQALLLFARAKRLPDVPFPPPDPDAVPDAQAEDDAPRALVLHYHLFKNAGTSVDVVLQANFGAAWREAEFPTKGQRPNVEQIESWLLENRDVKALSSHTAILPPPRMKNLTVIPIVFVRHPIDRIRSAYEFERRQNAETPGARLAREADFAGYVRSRLATEDRQCRNFQTHRLAAHVRSDGPLLQRALKAVDELPFVGLVEDFAQSMQRMEPVIRLAFPEFRAFGAKANVWRDGDTLEDRMRLIRLELGPELYDDLAEANREDLEVFAAVAARYAFSYEPVAA